MTIDPRILFGLDTAAPARISQTLGAGFNPLPAAQLGISLQQLSMENQYRQAQAAQARQAAEADAAERAAVAKLYPQYAGLPARSAVALEELGVHQQNAGIKARQDSLAAWENYVVPAMQSPNRQNVSMMLSQAAQDPRTAGEARQLLQVLHQVPDEQLPDLVKGIYYRTPGGIKTYQTQMGQETKPKQQITEIGVGGDMFQKVLIDEMTGKEIAKVGQPYRKREGLSVTLTPPQAGVDAQGKPVFFQVPKAGGQPQILTGVSPTPKPERALPNTAAQALMTNQQNLRRAEQALALIEGKTIEGVGNGDTKATGLWTAAVPDVMLNRVDPAGADTRAAIADLGSLIIHDRSGAAVTASEYPRLRPFIPLSTDKPEIVRLKLKRFVTEYRNIQQEMTDFYTESGYKVPTETLKPSGADMATPTAPSGLTPAEQAELDTLRKRFGK